MFILNLGQLLLPHPDPHFRTKVYKFWLISIYLNCREQTWRVCLDDDKDHDWHKIVGRGHRPGRRYRQQVHDRLRTTDYAGNL